MMLPEIEVGLTDEEKAVRDTVHKFAAEVMRPIAARLDKLPNPEDVIAKDSELWTVFNQYWELGIGLEGLNDSGLDAFQQTRLRSLINEELGWGDGGMAISLTVSGFPTVFARMSQQPELLKRYCQPDSRFIGCWAITEPSHGSDMLKNDPADYLPPGRKPDCVAELVGEEWVINGQKSAWVSNGTIATVGMLHCSIIEKGQIKGGAMGVVPFDLPGVSKGKPLNKLGQRCLNQGEIFFDNVRVPKGYLMIGPEMYTPVMEFILSAANGSMGQVWVGAARAAMEHAIDYAKERVQGGRPIFEHPSVKSRLFKMFMRVEAARSLSRRVAYFNASSQNLLQYSIAAKVFATTTAFDVSSEALQIFGGNGLTKEYPIEKLLRDTRASMIEDGCNELLGIVGAAKF